MDIAYKIHINGLNRKFPKQNLFTDTLIILLSVFFIIKVNKLVEHEQSIFMRT